MYEKRRKGRKRRKRKKKRSLVPLPLSQTHTRTSTLSLNSPSLYIYYIYNLESRIVLCALYRCLPASVTTSSILQAPIFFYPVLSLSATPTNSILDPLHFPSPRLRNLSRHTRHTLTYKSATHETRHQRYGRPIARRRFSRWINSFSSRWPFLCPFFPTTFAAPLTNDYCLSEIRTATISPPGVYYFRRRCRERRDPSIRLHSFLLFRQHRRRLRARFRFFPYSTDVSYFR